MRSMRALLLLLLLTPVVALLGAAPGQLQPPQPLRYRQPGAIVDLGVGLWAWPLPMDYDGDGDMDLVVSCHCVPFGGTYLFENPDGTPFPTFLPPRRVGPGYGNISPSYVGNTVRVLIPGSELVDYRRSRFRRRRQLLKRSNVHTGRVRANQWKLVDYDGDGLLDLVVGVGDWADYGWDNAFDRHGRWIRGPLHGYIYLLRNQGTPSKAQYAPPRRLEAGGKPIDVYGMPSPNFADFDGDGDLDLLCGEFVDGFTYFENIGSRRAPRYAPGRRLRDSLGRPLTMPLCMIVPVAVDWDRDGDVDLIVGQEDGRVAWIEHTGRLRRGLPVFKPPRFFKQQADRLKFGALVTPVAFDWDGDGDEDLLCGNTAGQIGWFENLGPRESLPRWAPPRLLDAGGKPIRIMAGPNGSIQGPCERKWGYTTLSVADWDQDGLPDLIVNSIWGRVVWFRNVGSRRAPKLADARPIEVLWNGRPRKPAWNWWDPAERELVTQWRTTPIAYDLTGDGLTDLIMLDHEGYLALYERARRDGALVLLPPRRIFRIAEGSWRDARHRVLCSSGGLLRLNAGTAGRSGRRKLALVDWDRDGNPDLLVNSENCHWLRTVRADLNHWAFEDRGPLLERVLAGHTTCPTVVDFDRDGRWELVLGAEDGHLYYAAP